MRVLNQLQSRFGLRVRAPWLMSPASVAQLDAASLPVSAAVPAGPANSIVKFHGKSNTANFRLLDYALAVITHGGPNPGDFIPVRVLRWFSDLIRYRNSLGLK